MKTLLEVAAPCVLVLPLFILAAIELFTRTDQGDQ